MKRVVLYMAWFILLLASNGIQAVDDVFNKHSLLPTTTTLTEHSTAIVVATQDGSIYLVDANSRNILWSFASGTPIYSSYQALPDYKTDDDDDYRASELSNFYIDIGDDWEIYANGPGYEKAKLPLSIEELIKNAPIISPDGGVLLGSKNTTLFLVDAKSGRIINAFRSDNPFAIEVHNEEKNPIVLRNSAEEVEQILYVTRKDYTLRYISGKTGKEKWHLKFADIEASFRCQETGKTLDEVDGKAPLDCQGSAVVYKIRDQISLERPFWPDGLLDAHPGARMPYLPGSELALSLQPPENLREVYSLKEVKPNLALPAAERESSGILNLPSGDVEEEYNSVPREILAGSHMWYLVVVVALLASIIVFFSHLWTSVLGRKNNLHKQIDKGKEQAVLPKKKKSRKAARTKNDIGFQNLLNDKIRRKPCLTVSNLGVGSIDGRKIGNMLITDKEIAKGSNGTIVWEGLYNDCPVAIKCLVRTHHDVALKEVQNLVASDFHPNIVRLYGIEYDQDFIYLSLELCTCNLYDLICSYSDISQDQVQNFSERAAILQSVMSRNNKFELWKANGYPSEQLLNIMRDIVSGAAHLHELGIVHRDLKPQNVLIIKQGYVGAKVSDMGISKRLPVDMSSLTENSTGGGSSGWQAPEKLRHERQTRSVDLFTLGCLLFFCLTGGQHPFGDGFERDRNIVKNHKDLLLIEHIPEAVDLISQLLDPNPSVRPKAVDVLHHPLFWDAEMRLSFLRDASDRVQDAVKKSESEFIKALESTFPMALGGKWDEKMDSAFINDLGSYRRYKFDSVCDLLRVIRNKLSHYLDLSQEIREILGQPPEGFYSYFSSRFPAFLIEVYNIIYIYCGEEELLTRYFRSKTN